VAAQERAEFAVASGLELVPLGERPGLAFSTGVGPHSVQLVVLRWDGTAYRTVFEGTSNSPAISPGDVDGDGIAEIVVGWSPYCGGYAASPKLVTVYRWDGTTFREATDAYPGLVLSVEQNVRDALAGGVGWTPEDRSCLHWALGYLAERSGRAEDARREYRESLALDPRFVGNAPVVPRAETRYGPSYRVVAQAEPLSVVGYFYNRLAARDYASAWEVTSPRFRAGQAYQDWASGYGSTTGVELLNSRLELRDAGTAIVHVDLEAQDAADGIVITSRFDGSWTLIQVDGNWTLDSAELVRRG
jgi:hypothetical protein